jgi:hypothetical protein
MQCHGDDLQKTFGWSDLERVLKGSCDYLGRPTLKEIVTAPDGDMTIIESCEGIDALLRRGISGNNVITIMKGRPLLLRS